MPHNESGRSSACVFAPVSSRSHATLSVPHPPKCTGYAHCRASAAPTPRRMPHTSFCMLHCQCRVHPSALAMPIAGHRQRLHREGCRTRHPAYCTVRAAAAAHACLRLCPHHATLLVQRSPRCPGYAHCSISTACTVRHTTHIMWHAVWSQSSQTSACLFVPVCSPTPHPLSVQRSPN